MPRGPRIKPGDCRPTACNSIDELSDQLKGHNYGAASRISKRGTRRGY